MRRRRFLAGAAGASASLAGCTTLGIGDDPSDRDPYGSADPDWIDDGDDGDANGDEEPPDDEGHEGPTISPFDESTVVDFETAPLTAAVVDGSTFTTDGLAVAVDFERPATPATPATLTATVTNQHSFEQTFRSRRLPGLDSPTMLRRRDPDRHVVFLAPTPEHPLADTTPTYDRDENGRWRLESTTGEWFPETITLEPDETVIGECVLLGHPDSTEPAIEAGRYRIGRGDGGFTIACWSSERPGPETTSTFEGVTVPSLPDDQSDQVVVDADGNETTEKGAGTRWFHDATPETAVFLEPDTESITAPGSITFSLVNHGRDTLQGNPHYWRLYKLVEGTWLPIEPWGWPMPMGRLSPGDIHESTLACYAGEPVACDHARSVGHLGGGRYAYTAGYSGGAESNAHAAMFDLEAPALGVDLEDDAVVERRDGKTVVTLPEYDGERQPATMTVTRSSGDPDPDQQLLPEQLYRRPFRSLRNTLPAFESGVQTVHLRADRNVVGHPFRDADTEAHTLTYEGTVFEVSWALEDAN